MAITSRKDLNNADLPQAKKTYLMHEATQKAQRIASQHYGEWAFLALVGSELSKIALAQAPKQEAKPVEGMFDE